MMIEQEGQANVLLVDDRPENLLAMESILEDLGHKLIRANSGREALRLLLDHEYALILLDVQMPGLDGFELAELIRERERTERTPIIFITAVSKHEEYVFKGYSLGAVDYLTKPFEPEILKSKVRFFTELFKQNQKIKLQAQLLEEANAKLDRANLDLEARVKERTAQLEATNKWLENEVTTRKEAEARLATEHAITRTLADANNLDEAASAILRAFCDNLGSDIALLWLVTEDGRALNCSQTAVSNGTDDFPSFIAESRRINLGYNVGLPGRVWATRKPVWVGDTVNDGNNFPRARFAASVGLNSGIGFPIVIGRQVCGVIEIFTRKTLPYDKPLINMVGAIGSEIGQFIERKRVETERENLLRREKHLREQAETASRMKDEFLATVSHELRTPLNSILGWCQMLNERELNEEETDRALTTIYRNAKAQAQLIDDLLDTSRLITGNMRLNLSPTNIPAIIESVLNIVRPAAEGKNITIQTAYEADVKSVTCDPQRLQQMVWNLLTNAVKFTPNSGQVNVRVEQKGEKLQIIASDSGQGISPEFLPFVFDRFRQQDSSITRKAGGLGLGLAIVRHLAELHGGTVDVKSEGEGTGATFTITLPISLTADTIIEEVSYHSNGHETNESAEISLNDVRILVVDDDMDTREMMMYALSHCGAQTQTSGSVAEALAALAEWQPHIILADLSMPGEDGYSLISKVRSHDSKEKAEIPMIALTAHAHPEESKKALSAGFQLHLSKPVDVQKLAEAIINLTTGTVS